MAGSGRDDDGSGAGPGSDASAREELARALAELREAHEELNVERDTLAAVIRDLPVGVVVGGASSTILTMNEAGLRLHGFASEAEMLSRLDDYARDFELWLADGSILPTDRWPAARALRGDFVRDLQVRLRNVREGTERIVSYSVVPVRAASGEVLLIVYLMQDVTERTRADEALREAKRSAEQRAAELQAVLADQQRVEAALRASEERARSASAALLEALDATRRVEEKLRQAQKMEAVGRLAGGVAHDFNNILTVILASCDTLGEALPAADPLRGDVAEIEGAASRAAALTRQLLAFSRKQVLEPRVVSVNELLSGVEPMLRRLIGEDIELRLLLLPRVHLCRLDAGQFEQVIMNLVVNARDAMPEGGRITVESANVVLDEGFVAEHPEASAGEHVLVSITDTGAGMTKEVRAHLFEPFFTTKEPGRGTGLGLSTVYGIVRQSGGTVWVHSEPGQGSTFKLYFPRAIADRAEPRPLPVTPRVTTGTETLLLVEDDEQVRTSISAMLRRAGYHVLEAANGGEALLVCEQHGGRIQLLLTDVVMPRLNGRKLAERLRVVRPDLRVVFMSGYTEDAIVHHGVLDSGVVFLPKPISGDALLAKVRDVLDR